MALKNLLRLLCFIMFFLWMDCALAQPVMVTRILIVKSIRTMYLYAGKTLVDSYHVALGWNPMGPKVESGDGRTPEGQYLIDGRNPNSSYGLSLRLSYPNLTDQVRSEKLGVNPGGDIYIHGIGNYPQTWSRVHEMADWTAGCIAVTNAQIRQIWSLVPNGTLVTIRP